MRLEKHKCRVYKLNPVYDQPWVTECLYRPCRMGKGYLQSETWEEAMLEALHHRMRNIPLSPQEVREILDDLI
jgi:hypothetical protein